jgi:excisionase family DNA binding protein
LFCHAGEKMNVTEPPSGDVMDYRGLSKYLKVPYGSLRHKVMKGEVPHIKIGRSVRFHKKRIDEWLTKQEREPQWEKSVKGRDGGGELFMAGVVNDGL